MSEDVRRDYSYLDEIALRHAQHVERCRLCVPDEDAYCAIGRNRVTVLNTFSREDRGGD